VSQQDTRLVERYLREAKYWLPPAQRQDILAELAEDIRLQIEDREERLGRPLKEPELVGMGITLGVVAAILLVGIWVEERLLLRGRVARPWRAAKGLPNRSIAS
jgi:hypothetical protein